MKRYFFFAASYEFYGGHTNRNFGIALEGNNFPSMDYLKDIVKSKEKTASGIVVLSICELSEVDYKHLFKL